ncbi:hypothetical protein U9M48_026124 [Paspalum notatum var. saurae]|uniref:Exocyst subunit Exo70 family protein n=1 Tax=Paspalum notatum var. saurae TaxID=547442 RepID=A0AAQ3WYP6_PASNO
MAEGVVGDDGGSGCGSRWRWRSNSSACTTISSSSGTIVSTSTHSRSSAASRLSSVSTGAGAGAAAMLLGLEVDGESENGGGYDGTELRTPRGHRPGAAQENRSRSADSKLFSFDDDDDDDDDDFSWEETTEFVQPINKKPRKETTTTAKEKMKQMVQEFFDAWYYGFSGFSVVLERWFTEELGLDGLLHLIATKADGGGTPTSGGRRVQRDFCSSDDARSWIRALNKIMQTISSTSSFFPDHGRPRISAGEEEEEESCFSACLRQPCRFQFARFTQEAMSRMLLFVDFIAALDPKSIITRANGVRPPPYIKIGILMHVREALSRALPLIRLSFHSPPSARVATIQDELTRLLSAKVDKAREAIWTALEDARTRIVLDMDSTPQEPSSDIIKLTWSTTLHINFMLDNYSAVSAIVSEAAILGKYVRIDTTGDDVPPLDSMIMEMSSSLQDKLVSISKSFPDQGLGFLFLLNNTNFMSQQLQSTPYFANVTPLVAAIPGKVEGYMDSYIQVSWAPMLSCLSNHPNTPLCFMTNYSTLFKFESEFQKMYTDQKQWKVPHPELRKKTPQSYH